MLQQIFDAAFVRSLIGVLVLVAVDWLFGVIKAIKAGEFEWARMGDFYKTSVVPYVLGWLVLHVAVRLIGLFGLDEVSPILTDAISTGAYGILLVAMAAQVIDKIKSVFGRLPGGTA